MNSLRSALLWAAVIGCMGTACQKRIKTTSFIVGTTLSASPGISVGGKLQWVTSNGPPFVVHFYSESPCVGDKNDIAGTKDAPAVCTIKPGADGLLKFEILAQGEKAVGPKYPILAQIDWCPPPSKYCKASAPPPPPPPDVTRPTILNPPLVPIDCDDSNTAYADPPTLTVSAGQQVLWQQVGPDATTKWETVVPAGVCVEGTGKEATVFGTIVAGSHISCTITPEAKGTIPYSLKYTSTTTKKSCSGTANLAITNAP